jgi:hypothetical protein
MDARENQKLLLPCKRLLSTWSKTEYLLLLIVSLYVFCVWLIAQVYSRPEAFRGLLYVPVSGRIFFVIFMSYIFIRILWIMIWWHPKHLTKTILKDFRHTLFNPARLVRALPLALMFLVFFGAFSGMKSMIPVINPYTWDQTFAGLDEALHAGEHPWQLLQTVLGYPLVTSTLNIFYNLWLFFLIFIFFWQALTSQLPRVRLQFLLAFFLAWIVIGNVFATLFSSAGPCYYEAVTGTVHSNPYVELLTYLQQVNEVYPVWALKTQELLWLAYKEKKFVMGSGISAMPSMHATMAFLFMLLGWRWGRPYNCLLTIYLIMIVLGSIHLAWHYAVDAYFAIPLAYGIWRFSGFVVGRLEPEEVR